MISHSGGHCLRTNLADGDEETLWRSYATLIDVEAVFRLLNSEFGPRPILRRTQKRSDNHLFVTVIACQLMQTIRQRLRDQSEHAGWGPLPTIVQGQQRVTATFRRKDGRSLHVRSPPEPSAASRPSVARWATTPLPGASKKMIV